jgi:hypothetical protein
MTRRWEAQAGLTVPLVVIACAALIPTAALTLTRRTKVGSALTSAVGIAALSMVSSLLQAQREPATPELERQSQSRQMG